MRNTHGKSATFLFVNDRSATLFYLQTDLARGRRVCCARYAEFIERSPVVKTVFNSAELITDPCLGVNHHRG